MNITKPNLTLQVIIAMLAGITVGLLLNISGLNSTGSFVNEYIVNGLFQGIGKLFINALKMLVVPLVLFSLICGVCGIGNLSILGRVGMKSFLLYILTTAIAVATAILFATTTGIGQGMQASATASFSAKEAPALIDVLTNMIPTNPFAAMANGEMLQVIFFAILLGVSILMVGRKAKSLIEGAELANEVMMKMVSIVMAAAPYAVFALIAKAMAELGFDLLSVLAGYVLVLIAALMFHLFGTLMVLLKLLSGLSPMHFIRKMRNVQVFAFSTSSSNATIPVTIRTVTERLGVNNSVASFTVPFGATINMDGTAIMQGVATVFIANVYAVHLGLTDYLVVIAMAVLASIGTAGVPGVGLIMLSMVFVQVGLPVEGIGLILGVDRLLDMIRTAVNVSGDSMVSVVVAKSEGKLNETIYNDPMAGVTSDTIKLDQEVENEMANVIETLHARK
ncbi:dicarboxylate/amino acid:cation symporter [Thiothrix litoralis]|uniref:Dicarboxylate/amino acid:cation symporter n=1 Tax=Thiothrix litoralis TaxID=2891210 RepID=A0ABX7WU40_9GAMM|nr:dicarboxylate/amino acid:cation symporter [Thiothrix litoralis]QTR46532.1 dicarboxylate/amino acid:cation symporter [Thiothrix litoralis]